MKVIDWFKDKRKYSIMFVPHNGGTTKSVPIMASAMKVIGIGILAFIIFFCLIFSEYRYMSNKIAVQNVEVNILLESNTVQVEKINELTVELGKLKEKIKQLDATDEKVREIIRP